MARPHRNKLSDLTLVTSAQTLAGQKERTLRKVKEDTVRDSIVYEDRESGEQRSLPKKFIRALGASTTFELVDPNIDIVTSTELT
tara:strand:- start:1434 stop:1688 length:255 start_codon:yes stop_codon:yes gene_type:complete